MDLAFADALLQASELRPAQDPQNRNLYLKLQQAQAALADVLSRSEQLKAKIAAAKPAEKDALQDQQDLLEAEQALDEDEVEDAQQELIRTGGDQETAIQRQRDQHEAGMSRLESFRALRRSRNSGSVSEHSFFVSGHRFSDAVTSLEALIRHSALPVLIRRMLYGRGETSPVKLV